MSRMWAIKARLSSGGVLDLNAVEKDLDPISRKGLAIVCADVGSVSRNNFGWFSTAGEEGTLPSELVGHVSTLLNEKRPVALGFECPLFVPLRADERTLTAAREGEGKRAWSASAGACAMATGISQLVWILEHIRTRALSANSFLEWAPFDQSGMGLFLWEAFVSGSDKTGDHVGDAKRACTTFKSLMPDIEAANFIKPSTAVHSLAGAALLRTGWSGDLSLLSKPPVVIKG